MRKPFLSCFATHLASYVELRQHLGLKFETQAGVLYRFDRYVHAQQYHGPLTQDVAIAYAMHAAHLTPLGRSRQYGMLCNFSHYLAAFVPDTPLLDPHALAAKPYRPVPYIFTEEELGRLLHLAKTLPYYPIRRATLHAMIALVMTTGLRCSEVIHLDRADVDLTSGVLHIRQTKFYKERLVPVHPTTLAVLQDYARVRDVTYQHLSTPAFFISMYRTRFSRHTLSLAFRPLARAMGFSGQDGPRPTLHSLRHTFAVRRLEAWYTEGQDVQALLPSLATYLGHVHYTDTAYYITATPRLLTLAAARADTAWLAQATMEVPE